MHNTRANLSHSITVKRDKMYAQATHLYRYLVCYERFRLPIKICLTTAVERIFFFIYVLYYYINMYLTFILYIYIYIWFLSYLFIFILHLWFLAVLTRSYLYCAYFLGLIRRNDTNFLSIELSLYARIVNDCITMCMCRLYLILVWACSAREEYKFERIEFLEIAHIYFYIYIYTYRYIC